MAKRRMFNLDIIDTDLFIEMPQTSRLIMNCALEQMTMVLWEALKRYKR